MRLFIRYDKDGKIISAMKVEAMDAALDHPYGSLAEGEAVIEVNASKGLKAIDCQEISQGYTLDVKNRKLKKQSAKKLAQETAVKKKKPAKKPRRGPRT